MLGRDANGRYDEGHTICHSSLPGNTYNLPAAVCAWNAQHPDAGAHSIMMRRAALTGTEYINPPADSRTAEAPE